MHSPFNIGEKTTFIPQEQSIEEKNEIKNENQNEPVFSSVVILPATAGCKTCKRKKPAS